MMIRWFCNSHYVSHFAAFFIVARAKISVAESCVLIGVWLRESAAHGVVSGCGGCGVGEELRDALTRAVPVRLGAGPRTEGQRRRREAPGMCGLDRVVMILPQVHLRNGEVAAAWVTLWGHPAWGVVGRVAPGDAPLDPPHLGALSGAAFPPRRPRSRRRFRGGRTGY